MNIIKIAIMCLALTGCSQGPDFSIPSTVESKSSYDDQTAVYKIKGSAGVRGGGFGSIKFKAPLNFANVGDIIEFKEGVFMITKKNKLTSTTEDAIQ